MTVAYNIFQDQYRAREAEVDKLLTPGAAGTIVVTPTDDGVIEINVTGAYTLEAATGLPLGTRLLVNVTVAGVTVNGTAIADGETALFVVALSAAAVRQWIILA